MAPLQFMKMHLLKQKILFLLYFAQRYTPPQTFKKEEVYLSYNFLYQLLPEFVPASVRKATLELVAEAELERILRNGRVLFRLTLNGEKRVKNLFANFFYQISQKRGWFTAILREKKAERETRRQLEKLGFVRFIRGVYLLPAARDFQAKLEPLLNQVLLTFGLKLEFTDEKQLVGSLWPVNREHREVSAFINQEKNLLRKVAMKKKLLKKEIKSISALSSKFFIIIKNTIRLPKNLLPQDWPMPQAAGIMLKLLKKIPAV